MLTFNWSFCKMFSLDKYCATLAHKCNHSFTPNLKWGRIDHPRFSSAMHKRYKSPPSWQLVTSDLASWWLLWLRGRYPRARRSPSTTTTASLWPRTGTNSVLDSLIWEECQRINEIHNFEWWGEGQSVLYLAPYAAFSLSSRLDMLSSSWSVQ